MQRIFATLFFLLSTLLACQTHAESFIWKVSQGDNYFYLGGTIHLLSEDDYPLPDEFYVAYNDANTLVFETDMAALQTPAFQAKMMAAMTYSDNRTLTGVLKPETYRQLESFMASRQIPIENFSKFQPWGVATIITVMEYQRLGMQPQYGVEAYFNSLTKTDNKSTKGLETVEEQLTAIKSMASMDPDISIEYTLRDLKTLPEFISKMKADWRKGDIKAFADNDLILEMKTDYPEMYQALIIKRNNAWMEKLPALINDKDPELVLVGSMHLSGEDGLLHLLKSRGFTIEQL